MAEDGKKQNGSYHEVPLAEIVNGDVGEHAPTEETKEQGRENAPHLPFVISSLTSEHKFTIQT